MYAPKLFSLVIFSQAFIANCGFLDIGLGLSLGDVLGLKDDIISFHCDCAKGCSCCGQLQISQLNYNQSTCIALEYIGEKAALKVTITSNGDVLLQQTLSVNDLRPICVTFPGMQLLGDVCFKFHDILLTLLGEFNTCLLIQPRVIQQPLMNVEIGCLTVPSSSS